MDNISLDHIARAVHRQKSREFQESQKMKRSIVPANSTRVNVQAQGRPSLVARFISKRLAVCTRGRLALTLPSGEIVVQTGEAIGVEADITVHQWGTLARILIGGDIGFASSYLDGNWTTTDLSAVLAYLTENESAFESIARGVPFANLLNRLRHAVRRNSRTGSRRNISAHYDLGNSFYNLWLDPGMQYSSALYSDPSESLERAQARKLENVRTLLNLQGGETVLEIGSGWGALAELLAEHDDCKVTGITLSQQQVDYARNRLASKFSDEKTKIELRDYRDVNQTYDRIVSIEMFEAVGIAYWQAYFDKVALSLNDEGCAVLQVITITEDKFDAYLKHPDYIQRYIFPGGMLPTKRALKMLANNASLELVEQSCFGKSYQHTLAEWRHRFHSNWNHISNLGFDDRFRRKWDYYFRYCEIGFNYDLVDVGLYKFAKKRD